MLKESKILLLSSNLSNLGEGMLGPLFAVFAQNIGGNVLSISWAWATYLIITGILIMILGKFSDRKFKKENLLILGYALTTIFTFGYLLVSSPLELFIVQAGLGVALAFTAPTWGALYAKHIKEDKDGFMWGLAGGQAKLLTGLAILAGGLIVTYFSFNILFISMGFIQLAALIYISQLKKLS
jgi:MFS family permease